MAQPNYRPEFATDPPEAITEVAHDSPSKLSVIHGAGQTAISSWDMMTALLADGANTIISYEEAGPDDDQK